MSPKLSQAALRRVDRVTLCLLLLAPVAGCGDDDGGDAAGAPLQAFIEAAPAEGIVPLDVAFSLRVVGAGEADPLSCEWDFGDGHRTTGCAIQHVFVRAAVDPYVVRAGVVNGNTGETATAESVAILVHERADLQITALGAGPAELQAGDPLTLDLEVTNRGGSPVVASEACVYLVFDEPGALEQEVARLEVPALQPAEVHEATGQEVEVPGGLRGGSYYVVVELDCPGVVSEADEENNRATTAEPVLIRALTEGPDLLVSELLVSPTTVLSTLGGRPGNVDLRLGIVNGGNRLAGAFDWAVYLSADEELDPAGDLVLVSEELAGLQAQATELVRREGLPLPDGLAQGSYQVYARVDPDDRVPDETNEFNNERPLESPLQVVSGSVPGRDLILTAVRVTNPNVPLGGAVDVLFTLCNRGTVEAAGNFFASVILSADQHWGDANDFLVGDVNFFGLAAQSCVDARLTNHLPPSMALGAYQLGVWADPSDAVEEEDEDNNTIWYPQPVYVGEGVRVDLGAEGVSFAPSEIEAGDLLRVTFSIENLTPQRSGAFSTSILLSDDEVLDLGDRRIKEVVTPFLNGGTVLQVDELVPIPLDVDHRVATWRLGVHVDADDEVIGEPDEENNWALAPGELVVTGGEGGCFEDGSEPNDSLEQAAQVQRGRTERLGRCGNDDWFGVLVQAGESLQARIEFDHARGDLDLELLRADGTVLDASRSATGVEQVAVSLVPVDAVYYLHVSAATAVVENMYALELAVQEPSEDADLQPAALRVAPAAVIVGQPLQVDFEVLNRGRTASPASVAELRLSADGVLDADDPLLAVVDVPAVPALARLPVQAQPVPPVDLQGGSYAVFVALDAANQVPEADEDNNVLGSAMVDYIVPQDCVDDDLEPNNQCAEATPIADGVLDDRVACQNFDDWYALELQAGDYVQAEIRFRHSSGDLDLEAYAPDCQRRLALSRSSTDREAVELLADEPGTYRLRVLYFPPESGSNIYRLTVERTSCTRDAFEPNDEAGSAQPMGLGGATDLTTCGADLDYYLLQLPAGQLITFRTVVEEELPMTMTLYRWVEPPANPSFLRTRIDQPLSFTADVAGPYLLKVEQGARAITHYDLIIEGLEGRDLSVDGVTIEPAVALPGGLVQLRAALSNPRLDAVPAFRWRAYLSVDAVASPETDRVLGEGRFDGGIPGGGTAELSERLPLPADLQAGSYWVVLVCDVDDLVVETEERNNSGAAPLELRAPCQPDDDEPNDTLQQATELVPGARVGLSLCDGDIDTFRFEVPEGTVSAQVALVHLAARGDLDLFVYGPPDGAQRVGQSATASDREQVLLQAPQAGPHFVQVQALGDQENTYRLELELEPAP